MSPFIPPPDWKIWTVTSLTFAEALCEVTVRHIQKLEFKNKERVLLGFQFAGNTMLVLRMMLIA